MTIAGLGSKRTQSTALLVVKHSEHGGSVWVAGGCVCLAPAASQRHSQTAQPGTGLIIRAELSRRLGVRLWRLFISQDDIIQLSLTWNESWHFKELNTVLLFKIWLVLRELGCEKDPMVTYSWATAHQQNPAEIQHCVLTSFHNTARHI